MQLISLGAAAESGAELYIEVPYKEEACNSFVKETIIPLLGKIPNALCEPDELESRILTWLGQVRPGSENIEICFDYQGDWDLFCFAIDFLVPEWCKPRLIKPSELDPAQIAEFHKKTRLPVHHALYDARANRYAFEEVAGTFPVI